MKMSKLPDEWRRRRLADLAKEVGSNAELGRLLKYKDGAYVRQMIAGERPITEKTVAKAEALPGYAGWFDQTRGEKAVPPPPPPGFKDNRTLTEEQWEMYNAFLIMTTSAERRALLEKYQVLKAAAMEETRKAQNHKGKETP